MTSEFDPLFISANDEFFGGVFDWRWWKAQGMVESSLHPNATSKCGAKGIMQIMPATWDEIAGKISVKNAFDPADSIRAGVYYMRYLWGYWNGRGITDLSTHLKFCQGSYNAGMGNFRKAWLEAGLDDWLVIVSKLIDVTGKENATETISYVNKIWILKKSMK